MVRQSLLLWAERGDSHCCNDDPKHCGHAVERLWHYDRTQGRRAIARSRWTIAEARSRLQSTAQLLLSLTDCYCALRDTQMPGAAMSQRWRGCKELDETLTLKLVLRLAQTGTMRVALYRTH
jgi:hypothetical protein